MPRHAAGLFHDDDVRLGYVSGVFGVRGEMRLFLYNLDSPVVWEDGDVILVGPDGDRHAVSMTVRPGSGRRVLGRIEGVDTIEAAQALVDHELIVARARLPVLPEGEWYHRDILGLPVQTPDGRQHGRLADIHDQGEIEIWVVREGSEERYLLLTDEVQVDLEAGLIRVPTEPMLLGV